MVAIHSVSWDFKKDYFHLDLNEVTLDAQHRSAQYPRDHDNSLMDSVAAIIFGNPNNCKDGPRGLLWIIVERVFL